MASELKVRRNLSSALEVTEELDLEAAGSKPGPWSVRTWLVANQRRITNGVFRALVALAILATQFVVRDWQLEHFGDMRRLLSVTNDVMFLIVASSFCGIIYLGPGQIPRREKGISTQSPELLDAWQVGTVCRQRPFHSTDTWCNACCNWKPLFASHCSSCRSCCLWMDHHCIYLGTCIGLRNSRSFIVWLGYLFLWTIFWILVTCFRLWIALPQGFLQWLLEIFWMLFLAWLVWFAQALVNDRLEDLRLGWLWHVGYEKFLNVVTEADGLVGSAEKELRLWRGKEDVPESKFELETVTEQLRTAVIAVSAPQDRIRGPFSPARDASILRLLEPLFGTPPTWRWLIPCVPGPEASEPRLLDGHACDLWAHLARVLERRWEVGKRYVEDCQRRS